MTKTNNLVSAPPVHRLVGQINLWDRLLGVFGVKTTFSWCLVGCTHGRHSWNVSLEKCRDGTPIISGWFLQVYKFDCKEVAEDVLAEFNMLAYKHNKENGYWTTMPNVQADGADGKTA